VSNGDVPDLPELEPLGEAPPLPVPEEPTLPERLWRLVRDRKWVILQAVVIIPLAVLALTLHQQKAYTATSSLLFQDQPDLADISGSANQVVDPQRVFSTNKDLIDLPVVAQRTAAALGGDHTAGEVHSSISLGSNADSDVVSVEATTNSPTLSAKMANAYVDAYVANRKQDDRQRLAASIALVQRSLDALSPTDRAGSQGAQLSSRLNQLKLAQSIQTGGAQVVQRADVPTSPSSPSLVRNLVLGFIVAIVVGLALAALVEQLDRRIKVSDDVEGIYGLPVIARIPRSPRLAGIGLLDDPEALSRSPEIEAFRMLRGNLRYLNFGHDVKSILVASASQGDGKSTVARHLAVAMASMGDSVVLVEGDLHKGASPLVGAETSPGLSGLLVGASLQEALVSIELPSLAGESSRQLNVLPSGPTPPNASELLGSSRMLQVLHGLEKVFDVVIVDSPPLSAVSDALALVPEVSGVLVVCGLGQTTRDGARRLRRELALLGGRALGVVANFTPRNAREYQSYASRV
jgi:succinoglycan biosynthesis transport protein ExoP